MDASDVVNFSAFKSAEQVDAVIAELNDYKATMINDIILLLIPI